MNKDYKICLLLGGNQDDVIRTFDAAKAEIGEWAKVTKESALYRTKAWGMENAGDFINQAIEVVSGLEPQEFLKKLHAIERKHGRVREEHPKGYQSRTLDIDILCIEDMVINSEGLTVPHPRLHLRNFTLVPLAGINPNWVHPLFHKTTLQLLAESPDDLTVEQL